MEPLNIPAKFELRSLTRSRDRGSQKFGPSLDTSTHDLWATKSEGVGLIDRAISF